MVDLSQLLSGEVSAEEEAELLTHAIVDLDAFLQAEPLAEQNVQEILNRQLRDGIDSETWGEVGNSMMAYLGGDRAQLVEWLLTGDRIKGLQQLEKYASPKAMAFLRMIVGIFGSDLSKAYFISDQLPHDWRYIYRNVYHDAITDRYLLRLRVEKNNGEEVVVEGDPNSFLHMTELLIRSLITLGNPEVFRPERVDEFLNVTSSLVKILLPEEEEEEEEMPTAPETQPTAESK